MSQTNADFLVKNFSKDLLEHVKKLFTEIHPSQFIYQLCQKIRQNCPIYEYFDDLNYKFKCRATLNNLIAEGYSNNNKKDSKSNFYLI